MLQPHQKTIHFITIIVATTILQKGHSPSRFFPLHHRRLPFPWLHQTPTSTPFSCRFAAPSAPHHFRAIYSTDTFASAAPPPQLSEFPTSPGPVLNQQIQESSNRNIVQESYTVPVIHRTVLDPNPVRNQQVVAGSRTPPLPPLSRNVSRSPSCGESPSTKRLKRMRDRLKEMSQWWNQVVCEGEEEEENESEDYSTDNINNVRVNFQFLHFIFCFHDESEVDMENPPQEAVWVEKNGECLVLHFKCPCGNGYQILLFRSSCYYKLTNFRTQ
ncbi:UNVERIFIED_CONTAM: hypothetical protein Sradi_3574800 [Sesamum radiatum]|uniref:Uncharacterized protein n=1 Tax=Sesamum radiatum TaxID=300843 RepID=A0AAW2QG68_SESRA